MENTETTGAGLPLLPGGMNPAGRVVVALPDDETAAVMARALGACGFQHADVQRFSAAVMSRWLKSLLPDAGRKVGYGPLVPGLRDYYILALERCGWLVVRAPDDETARKVVEFARRAGARSTRHYRLDSESVPEPGINTDLSHLPDLRRHGHAIC